MQRWFINVLGKAWWAVHFSGILGRELIFYKCMAWKVQGKCSVILVSPVEIWTNMNILHLHLIFIFSFKLYYDIFVILKLLFHRPRLPLGQCVRHTTQASNNNRPGNVHQTETCIGRRLCKSIAKIAILSVQRRLGQPMAKLAALSVLCYIKHNFFFATLNTSSNTFSKTTTLQKTISFQQNITD